MNLRKLFLIGSLISIIGSQIVQADPMIFDAERGACQNVLNGAVSYPEQMRALVGYSSGVIKDKIEKLNSFTFAVTEENQTETAVTDEHVSFIGKKVASFGVLTKEAFQTIKETVKQQGGYFVQTIKDHKLAVAGVVAVISLSGLTYYLYENGQLNLIGQKAQTSFQKAISYKKTLMAAGLLAASGVALYAAYKTGYMKLNAVDQAKDTITGTITLVSIFSKIAAAAGKFNTAFSAGKAHVVNSLNKMTSFMETPVAPSFTSNLKNAALMVRPYAQPLPILACTGIAAATGYMATKFYKEYKTK